MVWHNDVQHVSCVCVTHTWSCCMVGAVLSASVCHSRHVMHVTAGTGGVCWHTPIMHGGVAMRVAVMGLCVVSRVLAVHPPFLSLCTKVMQYMLQCRWQPHRAMWCGKVFLTIRCR